jgi:polyisoprenoid-binding protein YceI
MLRSILALIVLAGMGIEAAPRSPDEIALDLDPARTEIQFTLGDVLHTVHGTFQLKSGTIRFDSATGKAGGEVIVDAASGASGSKARDRRMHKDVLESQRYPEAIFTPDRIEGSLAAEGPATVEVHGLFKIHGTEHEVTLQAQVSKKGGQWTAATHFVVPYVKWGMKNPSTFLLRVNDKVEIDIHATARARAGTRQPAPAETSVKTP